MIDLGSRQRVHHDVAPIRKQVADRLRESIARGRLPAGTRLVERELVELTGAGRPSVREALRTLESEGLIESVPHHGVVVATLTPEDAIAIYEIREPLEALAAGKCAQRSSELDRADLRSAVDALGVATDADDLEAMLAAKDDFYIALLVGASTPVLSSVLHPLRVRSTLLRSSTLSVPGRAKAATHELAVIADRIDLRDAPGAAAAARRHVRMAAAVAKRTWRS